MPKKRELKKFDRICERHFKENDISTTWEHIINGELHKIDRDKPKLNPKAVPSYNLPDPSLTNEEEKPRKTRKRTKTQQQHNNENHAKKQKVNTNDIDAETWNEFYLDENETEEKIDKLVSGIENPLKISESEHSDNNADSIHTILSDNDNTSDQPKNNVKLKQNTNDEGNEIENEEFDSLYDDIFEIELPNTLWGLHRDPNRKFIVFSFYDASKMKTTKSLYIDHKFVAKSIFGSNIIQAKILDRYDVDVISKLINNLHEMVFK